MVRIREALTKLFRQRECMVFVRPADDERTLQNLSGARLSDLRPQFVQQFDLFKKKVFLECPLKTVNGKTVTGRMVGSLLEQYVRAINEGAVPNISAAWDTVVDTELRKAFEAASKLLQERAERVIAKDLPEEQEVVVSRIYVSFAV